MRQTAQVTRVVAPGYVEVKIRRASACGGVHRCGSCDVCALMANAPEIVVVARDEYSHEAGETVTVESATTRVLGAAAVLYLAPFLLFFMGYCLGKEMGLSEGASIGLGGAGFALGILSAMALDRYIQRRHAVRYQVV